MQKTAVFLPQKADFCEIHKNQPCANLSFDPKKLHTKFHKNPLISFPLSSGQMDAQTHGQD